MVDKTSVHGTIACIAWLIFLVGAILMRLLNGPKNWLIHASTQVCALILFIAGAALGIQLAGSNGEASLINFL